MSPCLPVSPSYTTTQNRMILRPIFHYRPPLSRLVPPVVPPRGRGLAATDRVQPRYPRPAVAWTPAQAPTGRQPPGPPHPPATHPIHADTVSTCWLEPTP